jgi:hypothetical protein
MQTRARGMGMSFVTRFKILAESEKISEDLRGTRENGQNTAKPASPTRRLFAHWEGNAPAKPNHPNTPKRPAAQQELRPPKSQNAPPRVTSLHPTAHRPPKTENRKPKTDSIARLPQKLLIRHRQPTVNQRQRFQHR